MAVPNDLILKLVRNGDDLDILQIELIQSPVGNNTVDMESLSNVQCELFQGDEFGDMADCDVALCRCVWEEADPENGKNYAGYVYGDFRILEDTEV